MGKKLVIAEKPSQARAYAAALGVPRKDNLFENDEWIIVNARGHIVDLVPPDDYETENWGRPWKNEQLPMLPVDIKMGEVKADGIDELLNTIKQQANREDVEAIVCATDPEREGEGIFRRIIKYLNINKPTYRMWCDATTDKALREAFSNLKPDKDYDGYGNAAWARAVSDWYVGMNLTRAACCTYLKRIQLGRVMTSVLALISERTNAHRNFKVSNFYQVEVTLEDGLVMRGERLNVLREAENLISAMRDAPVEILSIERKKQTKKAPALFDLSSLQKEASSKFGMSLNESLSLLQELYESGYVSYPRTDSRYLANADKELVELLTSSSDIHSIMGNAPLGTLNINAVIDDSKVMGHGAILPTDKLDYKLYSELDERKQSLILLICTRLFEALGDVSIAEKIAVSGVCAGIELKANISEELQAGWKAIARATLPKSKYEEAEEEKQTLDKLPQDVVEGAKLAVASYDVHEGTTTPPALFTDATLIAALADPRRYLEDEGLKAAIMDDSAHPAGIGTPATRTPTLEKLITLTYVERKGRSLQTTDLGETVVKVAPQELKDIATTAKWEEKLGDVLRQELSVEDFLNSSRELTARLVDDLISNRKTEMIGYLKRQTYGKCPNCGKDIIRSKTGKQVRCSSIKYERIKETKEFVLVDEGCGFSFSGVVCKKLLTDKEVAKLLENGRVHVTGMQSKKGTSFEADVVLDPNSQFGTRLDFETNSGKRKGRKRARSNYYG